MMSNIGHNRSPYDLAEEQITDLYDEAKQWLDGEPVASQGEADGLSKLIDMLRKARKEADAARVEEKRPHDEAAKAVQTKYKPLLEMADRAVDMAKDTLAPWLTKLQAEQEEAERIAREEAEAAMKAAQEAHKAAEGLEGMEAAEDALHAAKAAERALRAAEKAKPHAKNDSRAIGLQTVYKAEITDSVEFAKYCWQHHYAELLELMQKIADRDVKVRKCDLPGVKCITENKVR